MTTLKECFLIDNDEDDQEIFLLALSEVEPDIRCIAMNSGQAALKKLESGLNATPSFIFIDMNMPMMNGIQCLEEIRKMEHLRDVPIYMYSTAADPRAIEEVKQLGATDFIIKPASFAALRQLLATILKQ